MKTIPHCLSATEVFNIRLECSNILAEYIGGVCQIFKGFHGERNPIVMYKGISILFFPDTKKWRCFQGNEPVFKGRRTELLKWLKSF
jgi:hypothetical protein